MSTALEYARFLQAIQSGEILSALRGEMWADNTPSGEVLLVKTPIGELLGFEWHYAYGSWRECTAPQWEPA